MSTNTDILGYIQQLFFDVCDLLDGQSYKDIGYETRDEMLEEFKLRLEQIEANYKELTGLKDQ